MLIDKGVSCYVNEVNASKDGGWLLGESIT